MPCVARPRYPWFTASLASLYPLLSSAMKDGRATLEPSEWQLNEAELTEFREYARDVLRWCGWVSSCGAPLPPGHDYSSLEETKSDWSKIFTAADTALFELDGCDWARVSRSSLESVAALDGQQTFDAYL